MTGEDVAWGVPVIVIILFMLFYMALLAYAVIAYILGSKGLYAIAARRGIKNPWMAWIPVVSNWILGSVSDQYQQRKYGADPKLRKKLLILSIITQSGMTTVPVISNFSITLNFGDLGGVSEPLPESLQIVMLVLLGLVMILAMAALVLSIIQTVYQYKAYYGLYASCKPKMAVAFLLLSILTPVGPFLVYACRNDDEGMPATTEE